MWTEHQRELRDARLRVRGLNGFWRDPAPTSEVADDTTYRRAEQLLEASVENGGRPLTPGPDVPHMTASHVTAPRFAAWLERQELVGKLDERDKKKVNEWRRGDRPRITIATVDRILTRLGTHLTELPEEIFL